MSDLSKVKGRHGKTVKVTETGNKYAWDGSSWQLEADSSYKSYLCQVFQSSTNAPYDNVLGSPSLGGLLQWERVSTGIYRATLEEAFPEYRTVLIHSGVLLRAANSSPPSSPPGPAIILGYVSVERVDYNTLILTRTNSELALADGLFEFNLEIRVYGSNNLRD